LAPTTSPARAPSLSVPWARPISARHSPTRARRLTPWPHPSVPSLPETAAPARAARGQTAAHTPRPCPTHVARTSRWRPRTPSTLPPLIHSLPAPFFPPSSQCRHHRCTVVLPPTLRPHRSRFLGELRLNIRNSGRASIYALPLWLSLPTLIGPPPRKPHRHRRRHEPSSCLCRRSKVPETSLEVTNLPRPIISPSPLSVACDSTLE
jgi:hypothetical protein